MKKIVKLLEIGAGVALLLGLVVFSSHIIHVQAQDGSQADLGASGAGDNVPATFTPSQVVSNGTDGNPVYINVENTGVAPWYDDVSTVVATSGACVQNAGSANGSGVFVCPDMYTGTIGSSCNVSLDNYSSVIQLHTDNSNPPQFAIGNDPENYMQLSTNTCTLLAHATKPPQGGQNFCSPPTGTPADPSSAQQGYSVNNGSPYPGDNVSCNGYVSSPWNYDWAYGGPGSYCAPFSGEVNTPAGDAGGYPYIGPLDQDPDPGNPDTAIVCNIQTSGVGYSSAQYDLESSGATEVDPGDTASFPLGYVQAPSSPGIYEDDFYMNSDIAGGIAQYGPNGDSINDFGSQIPLVITVKGVPPVSTVTSVDVTCTPSTIDMTQTSQCTATVNGTGNPSQAVNWSATDGNINSGGVFTPSAPGSATITATSVQNSSVSGTATVTVNGIVVPPLATSIKVISLNSQQQNNPVKADWYFTSYKNQDPCAVQGATCTNAETSISNDIATGTYDICDAIDSNCHASNPTLYTLNSVKEVPSIVQPVSHFDAFLSFEKNAFAPSAHALSFPTSNPSSQSVTAGTPDITFIMLWDPIADISLNPNPVSISGTAGGSPVTGGTTLTNSGAPGSELTWTATVDPADVSWLSVSPTLDASQLGQGAPDNLTITADPSSLSVQTYTGIIWVNGVSVIDGEAIKKPITVEFSVNAPTTGPGNGGGGSGYSCNSNNQCVPVPSGATYPDPGGQASCNAACGSGGNGGNGGGPAPSCTFSASPHSVVIPQQATLQYDCTNVTSCSISGGNIKSPITINPANGSTVVNGTTQVSPTSNSVYTISCSGPGGTTSATAPVGVGNSTLCESNPGGVNCPTP